MPPPAKLPPTKVPPPPTTPPLFSTLPHGKGGQPFTMPTTPGVKAAIPTMQTPVDQVRNLVPVSPAPRPPTLLGGAKAAIASKVVSVAPTSPLGKAALAAGGTLVLAGVTYTVARAMTKKPKASKSKPAKKARAKKAPGKKLSRKSSGKAKVAPKKSKKASKAKKGKRGGDDATGVRRDKKTYHGQKVHWTKNGRPYVIRKRADGDLRAGTAKFIPL